MAVHLAMSSPVDLHRLFIQGVEHLAPGVVDMLPGRVRIISRMAQPRFTAVGRGGIQLQPIVAEPPQEQSAGPPSGWDLASTYMQ